MQFNWICRVYGLSLRVYHRSSLISSDINLSIPRLTASASGFESVSNPFERLSVKIVRKLQSQDASHVELSLQLSLQLELSLQSKFSMVLQSTQSIYSTFRPLDDSTRFPPLTIESIGRVDFYTPWRLDWTRTSNDRLDRSTRLLVLFSTRLGPPTMDAIDRFRGLNTACSILL